MPTLDAAAARIAARQHSHITRQQALAIGFTDSGIKRRVAAGRWVIVHAGVYRIAGAPRTWEGRATAAMLSRPARAIVSHRCAAYLWGLEGFGPPGVIDVTVARHTGGRATLGIRLHESLAFHLIEEAVRAGVPVTDVARTILDVCASVDEERRALRALDSALRRRIVAWDELWRCLVLHAARGRNGIVLFRQILIKRHGARVPDEKIAAIVLDLILDHGLPEPVCEQLFTRKRRRYFIDIAYPHWKIAIECDGKLGHLNDEAFEKDPKKRNALELDGWLVLSFTWERIRDDPADVVAEIREAIALRSG